MAASKINSNLKNLLFQIGWIIINAIRLFSVLSQYGSRHYRGVLWDVCESQRKNFFTLHLARSASQISTVA